MTQLSKKAIRILRKVQKCILAEPELYDQQDYPDYRLGNPCSTPGCIAGWVAWVLSADARAYNRRLRNEGRFTADTISVDLGISHEAAKRLFLDWPEGKYQAAWCKPGTKAAARAAFWRIELFIKTDGKQ